MLAVAFVADEVQHHARWRFDHKHMGLEPDNVEASTLSQQGVPAALTPRLRAIEPTAPVTIVPQPTPQAAAPARQERPAAPHGARVAPIEPDRTRFDSAAFRFPPLREEPASPAPVQPAAPIEPPAARSPRADAPAARTTGADTDRLARLARRRGEREPAPLPEDADEALPSTTPVDVIPTGEVFAPRPKPERRESASIHRLPVRSAAPEASPTVEIPAEDRPTEPLRRRRDRGGLTPVEHVLRGREADAAEAAPPQGESPQAEAPAVRPRRGRTSMPSWDEIVFGRDEP